MANEFKDAWKKVSLPLQSELESVMQQQNLEIMHQKKMVRSQVKDRTKKPRQSNRKMKIMNAHVEHMLVPGSTPSGMS